MIYPSLYEFLHSPVNSSFSHPGFLLRILLHTREIAILKPLCCIEMRSGGRTGTTGVPQLKKERSEGK
jgi:hypothetical protein